MYNSGYMVSQKKKKKKVDIYNPMNSTHRYTHIFIAYTWNICNFDLTYDIFLSK